MGSLRYVEMVDARDARGLRLVVGAGIPSPWSEAAKGLFHVQGIGGLAVRFRRGDVDLASWTKTHNAPAAFYDHEPPRTGWADILTLADRLGPRGKLVPEDPDARMLLFGMAHELAGEEGLGWSSRLVMIHGSITTEGGRSFPLPIARHLAPK